MICEKCGHKRVCSYKRSAEDYYDEIIGKHNTSKYMWFQRYFGKKDDEAMFQFELVCREYEDVRNEE